MEVARRADWRRLSPTEALRDASEDSRRVSFINMSTSLSNSACPNASRVLAGSLGGSLAGNVAGGAARLKAIAAQLEGVREDFAFVLRLLKNQDRTSWDERSDGDERSGDRAPGRRGTNGEEASRRLARAVVLLRSALDAIAVLDNDLRQESERVAPPRVSFWTTDLCLPGARGLQIFLRTRASRRNDADPFYLDFDGLASFWTRYYPGPLEPEDSLPHRDFYLSVRFCSNGAEHAGSTGPVLHDLLLPALSVALRLVSAYAGHFEVPEADIPGTRDANVE